MPWPRRSPIRRCGPTVIWRWAVGAEAPFMALRRLKGRVLAWGGARACPVDLWCRLGLDSAMADDRLNRHDLSDSEWALLGPLLPAHPRQGHRWNDHRVVIDGIFHRTRAGCPWRDLPERFGNWKSVYNRQRRWSGDGTWEKILDALRAGCDQAEGTAWTVAADATVVRAHQHAAGARREPPADVPAERLAVTVLSVPVRTGG